MKRILSVILLLIMTLTFSGCIFSTGPSATEMAKSALECFDNDDVEGLKSLFCEEVLSDVDDLDEQIEEAFAFYQGKSISKGPIGSSSEKKYREGNIVECSVEPYIADIKTDSGKEYDILVYTYTVNEAKPERVGIYLISIYTCDENDELILGIEIGEFLD